ncbi:MAG: hypothetical protein ACOWWO_07050 [Peptococcaceae bacterium]
MMTDIVYSDGTAFGIVVIAEDETIRLQMGLRKLTRRISLITKLFNISNLPRSKADAFATGAFSYRLTVTVYKLT